MPMNEEVRKAVDDLCYANRVGDSTEGMNAKECAIIRAELTRLTEIAEGVDPLVVRLGEVTEELERANAWNERVSVCRNHTADVIDGTCLVCRLEAANALLEIIRTGRDGKKYDYVEARDGHMVLVDAHLSEPRT